MPHMMRRPCFFISSSATSRRPPHGVEEITGGAIIDAGIYPRDVGQPAHLVVAAHRADDATALDLRDLADDGADGSGRRRDEDRLSGLRLADPEQARVRREAGHAEDAEIQLQWRELRIDLLDHGAVRDPVLAPAAVGEPADVVAGLEAV